GALYATSALANGLFAGNPWSLGIAGGFSSPTTAALIRQADLILGMGVGFRDWTTRHGALIGDGATVVQVDADPTALGRHRPVDVAIVGDTAATATAVSGEMARRGVPARAWRTDALATQIREGQWRHQPYVDASADGRLDPRAVAIRLNEMLPPERTVVVDGGDNTGYPILYWDVPDPSGFVFTSAGFQSIALGLSSAVGAAIARPERLTVASVGDGGLLMAASELETVARLGLRLLVVVFNDAAYGAEVHHFRPAGEPVELVQFPETDAAAWAAALGIASCRVRTLDDLEPVGAWITDGTGPMLVDVRIDPDVVLDWAAEAFKGH
ncbi:MAG: thiamine pyrophosphate-binding protein, partial [Actinomycetota bacterium]